MRYSDIAAQCLMIPRHLDYNMQVEYIKQHRDKTLVFYLGPSIYKREYQVVHNGAGLLMDEIALFCDNGNLAFGYRLKKENIIIVHEGG